MKSLRITNIVLFILLCICQAFALYVFVSCLIPLISGEVGGVLGALLGLLPIYIISILATCFLTIVLSITTKKLILKKQEQSLSLSLFDKLCKKLPLIFVIADIILLVVIFIIAKVNN